MSTRPKARRRAQVRLLSAAQLPAALRRMSASSGTGRFAAGKAVAATAERAPQRVYPYFGAIAALLDGDCQIVRWNAIQALGRLEGVDAKRRIDEVLEKLIGYIGCGQLVTAVNAIEALGRVARAREDLRKRVIVALLAVEQATHKTPECGNVARGKVLEVLSEDWPAVRRLPGVIEFVNRLRGNSRAAVARRAAELMKSEAAG